MSSPAWGEFLFQMLLAALLYMAVHLTGPAHTEDMKRMHCGRLTPVYGCCARQQGNGGIIAAPYIRERVDIVHKRWLLAHTVSQ